MSCSKSTLCSWGEESWWPMFVQLVYFSRPSLLRKARSSGLCPHKHTNTLQRGPELHLHANEEPPEEASLPGKGRGSPAAFVPAPARPALPAPGVHAHGPPPDPHLPPGARPAAQIPLLPQPTGHPARALAAPCLPNCRPGRAGFSFGSELTLRWWSLYSARTTERDRTRGPERGQRWVAQCLPAIALRALTTWEVGPAPALSF